MEVFIWHTVKGSPPRMRGKPCLFSCLCSCSGITPAHAGKTGSEPLSSHCRWDHPRACGENSSSSPRPSFMSGSPPRMRGKRQRHRRACRGKGITPAHAGKTATHGIKSAAFSDHPRACGENLTIRNIKAHIAGSPPRMRGKPISPETVSSSGWITPAHAGKTRGRQKLRIYSRDHPRVCGENLSSVMVAMGVGGSPPRVRGKPRSRLCCLRTPGITPACAGKTWFYACIRALRWDHPRVCGENCLGITSRRVRQGSPPRVRGKPNTKMAQR